MKKIELIFLCLLLISVLLKIVFVPGASILFVIVALLLGSLYMYGGFWLLSYKAQENTTKQNNIALSIISGLFLAIVVVAILFKLMVWPGSTINLIFGGIGTLLISIISIFMAMNKGQNTEYFKTMATRNFAASIVVLFLLSISSTKIYSFFHRNDPILVQKWINYQEHFENDSIANDFLKYQDSKK